MKMKPILFNTEMTRATLDGRKTATRRVIKKAQRDWHFIDLSDDIALVKYDKYGIAHEDPVEGVWATFEGWDGFTDFPCIKAPYQLDDILYVRETWGTYSIADGIMPKLYYRADNAAPAKIKWRPSIHMPREAARIFLRVNDVRVERLQQPFFEQGGVIRTLQAEGIDIGDTCRECLDNYYFPNCNDLDTDGDINEATGEDTFGGSECGELDSARNAFADLWDSTVKSADLPLYGWSANPWVWVIEFERISREEAERCEGNC